MFFLNKGEHEGQAAVVLTALLEGYSNDGIIQGAYSIATRIPTCLSLDQLHGDRPLLCVNRRCGVVFNQQVWRQ